jgi:5-methyltetrahydropteroyltriglutamate--homocysteine methyltransferase
MSGFGGLGERPGFADLVAYPSYLARLFAAVVGPDYVDLLHPPKAIGEVRYINREPLEHECADYVRIASDYQPGFRECFKTAPSPGIIALAMLNDHYPTLEAYVAALADALRVEYETIVGRGLVLQIDAPDLAGERHTTYANRPLKEFQEFVELIVAGINRALEMIPRDRVRLHVCWGNYEGPHDRDVPLADILPILLKTKCEAMLISMANPRHEHEYRCFAGKSFPSDMVPSGSDRHDHELRGASGGRRGPD